MGLYSSICYGRLGIQKGILTRVKSTFYEAYKIANKKNSKIIDNNFHLIHCAYRLNFRLPAGQYCGDNINTYINFAVNGVFMQY